MKTFEENLLKSNKISWKKPVESKWSFVLNTGDFCRVKQDAEIKHAIPTDLGYF